MRHAFGVFFVAALVVHSTPVVAQDAAAAVTGRVTDAPGAGLAGAEVVSQRPLLRVLTDGDGRFVLQGLQPGVQVLTVRHLGYRSVAVRLTLRPGATRDTVVALARLPAPLDAVRTEADAVSENLARSGFLARQRMGVGQFLTRDDLARQRDGDFWDAMRHVPFVEVVDGRAGRLLVTASRTCRLTVFVNGVRTPDVEGIPASFIDGVEVYRHASMIPAEYALAGRACGVVLVWTR